MVEIEYDNEPDDMNPVYYRDFILLCIYKYSQMEAYEKPLRRFVIAMFALYVDYDPSYFGPRYEAVLNFLKNRTLSRRNLGKILRKLKCSMTFNARPKAYQWGPLYWAWLHEGAAYCKTPGQTGLDIVVGLSYALPTHQQETLNNLALFFRARGPPPVHDGMDFANWLSAFHGFVTDRIDHPSVTTVMNYDRSSITTDTEDERYFTADDDDDRSSIASHNN